MQGQIHGQWYMTLDHATLFQQLPISYQVIELYFLLIVGAKHIMMSPAHLVVDGNTAASRSRLFML
jgi:hypothetical protein